MLAPTNSLRAKILAQGWRIFILPLTKFNNNRKVKRDSALLISSNLFDPSWYLANNLDVAQANIDPVRHYLLFGGFEGRDPSPLFSSRWYLDAYQDVKEAGINPLIHYLQYGKLEGRAIRGEEAAPLSEVEQLIQVDSQPSGSVDVPLLLNESRTGQMLRRLKTIVTFSLGIFDKYKRARLKYILKNDGLLSLIKEVNAKAKTKMLYTEDSDLQHELDEINAVFGSRLDGMDLKGWVEHKAKTRLRTFLLSDAVLELPIFDQPVVSIILLFYNRVEMSLQCLESLIAGAGEIPFEVVIVDNASSDETGSLLDRVRNAKILRSSINLGFGNGCNQAADLASGKYLLFLNNDTQLLPNSLKVMVDTFESGENIGAVGGKLIFPNGKLQEAGSMIWRDGSCQGYGRNAEPFNPEFSYVKDVDFCSAALLLTPKDLFLSVGKFDPRYAPAYYEDADYCLSVWNEGYRVVFQPFAVAIHYEFGGSGMANALKLQIKNREKFVEKWRQTLPSFELPVSGNIIYARERKDDSKRILFIDDQIPDYRLGYGFPRTYQILRLLAEMGNKLTFLPLQSPVLVPKITQSLQRLGVEVLFNKPGQKINLATLLNSRPDYYDIIFVSRPHNMSEAIKHIKKHARKSGIVYDAEALFSLRNEKFNELTGIKMTEADKDKSVQAEVMLAKDANVVTTVSEMEKNYFVKYGTLCARVLGHVVEPEPTPAMFEERKDILFIGGILGYPTPNEDAVRYFAGQIFPLVRQEVNCEFLIVGTNRVKAIWNLESEHIHVVGQVEDLTSYYNRCRLFVVPTRYSAGIPLKVLESAAHGLPAVVTPLTADQLNWQENRDILVGHDPLDFARKVIDLYSNRDVFYTLRQNALNRVKEEYSSERFRENLKSVINLAVGIKSGKN
jgi:GT2 family glycosyltransferase